MSATSQAPRQPARSGALASSSSVSTFLKLLQVAIIVGMSRWHSRIGGGYA